ncbi:MAG: hypothetical protein RLZZ628_1098 [Bacteroidota bacterium]|jgi:hypothetical protein
MFYKKKLFLFLFLFSITIFNIKCTPEALFVISILVSPTGTAETAKNTNKLIGNWKTKTPGTDCNTDINLVFTSTLVTSSKTSYTCKTSESGTWNILLTTLNIKLTSQTISGTVSFINDNEFTLSYKRNGVDVIETYIKK